MFFTLLALSLQVDFDLKFPWENNEEESFSSKSPRKLHNPYQKKYYKPVFPHLQSRCLHSQTMTYYPKPRFHSANEEEEGIHVDFDLKFPWEKNEKESNTLISSHNKNSDPPTRGFVPIPKESQKTKTGKRSPHSKKSIPHYVSQTKPKTKGPIPRHSKNEEEEGIHVDFDLKFPWEKNEKESFSSITSNKQPSITKP